MKLWFIIKEGEEKGQRKKERREERGREGVSGTSFLIRFKIVFALNITLYPTNVYNYLSIKI